MASPVDTFKTNLLGQLKSYSTAVQGVFEQRIARPLLAFKRDLSRPTSETRATKDSDLLLPPSSTSTTDRTRHESSASSSPLEIIDVDSTGAFRSIFDKVKNTFSPTTRRRTSDNVQNKTTNDSQSRPLFHQKSVSFADNIDETESDYEQSYSLDDQNEIVRTAHRLADQILIDSIDQLTGQKSPKDHFTPRNGENEHFQEDFRRNFKTRRISGDDVEELIYQDLSAEIVSYVLKHALRTLKKEQEQAQLTSAKTETDDDFIDLK